MTSNNYLPGITDVRIYNHAFPDEPLIVFSPGGKTEINIEFKLTGLNMLKDYLTYEMRDFYINVFLFKQIGGKENKLISHNTFHCGKELEDEEFVSFISSVSITPEKEETLGDFFSEFYYIEVIYSEKEAEDAVDLSYILNFDGNRMLRTKLMFTDGESNE